MRGGILRGPASVVSLEVRRLASLPAPLAGDCRSAKKFARHSPFSDISAKKLAQQRASSGISAKKFAWHARKHQFWAIFRTQGEFFRARTHHQATQGELFRAHAHTWPSRANFFAHRQLWRGDVETDNTNATEKRTQNTHFSSAKAMAVSDSEAAWLTGPGCGSRGRWRGLAGRPVDSRRYKRRQTNAIQITSRGPLLQTSSI